MPELPLIGGHNFGDSEKAHPSTCVNLYIDTSKEGQPVLRSRPGLQFGPDEQGGSGFRMSDLDRTGLTGSYSAPNATVTYQDHGFETGEVVDVTSAGDSGYDATSASITVVDTDTFTYDASGGSGAPAGGSADLVVVTSDGFYTGEIRALLRFKDNAGNPQMAVICGNRCYTMQPNGVVGFTSTRVRFTSIKGPIASETIGYASGINTQLVFCDAISAKVEDVVSYSITLIGTTWTRSGIIDTDSNTAAFMDGYLIRDNAAAAAQGQFLYSDLYDISAENSFNFATAEGSPDDVTAVLTDRRELWLFGEWTTEIWYNVGDQNNPFQRFQGGFVETGIAAPLTAKRFDNSIVWVAQDRRGALTVVRAGDKFQPIKISSDSVDKLLEAARGIVINAFAVVFRLEGHEFYALTIPGLPSGFGAVGRDTPITMVFDAVSKEWFKWESDSDTRWQVQAHAYGYDQKDVEYVGAPAPANSWQNRHYVGTNDGTGKLYFMAMDYTDDDGTVIACERTLPVVQGPDYDRVNAGPIELVTDADATETITVGLSYAKDGKTFGSVLSRSVTATSSRLLWKQVGRAYQWIFRLAQNTTATIPVRWIRLVSKRLGE